MRFLLRQLRVTIASILALAWVLGVELLAKWLSTHVGPPFEDPYKTSVMTLIIIALASSIDNDLEKLWPK
jgi:hypothetical protein